MAKEKIAITQEYNVASSDTSDKTDDVAMVMLKNALKWVAIGALVLGFIFLGVKALSNK